MAAGNNTRDVSLTDIVLAVMITSYIDICIFKDKKPLKYS